MKKLVDDYCMPIIGNVEKERFLPDLDFDMMYREMYWACEGYSQYDHAVGSYRSETGGRRVPEASGFLETGISTEGIRMENIINIQNLTKYYGKHRGIEDLSLSVRKGEVFGFIGPNGAGKSTTIRAMMGLLTPTAGKVEIFGLSVREHKTDILRRIGYMPSETTFYSGMRVSEVIRFSAGLVWEGLP